MLKRKMGIYLLSLLVITGLAGTIKDNTISKSERKLAIGLMKDSHKAAVKATKGLSGTQLNFKPSKDKWSIKDCIYHIAWSEKKLWGIFEKAMNGPVNPEKRAEITLSDEQIQELIACHSLEQIETEQTQPINTKYNSVKQALSDFNTTHLAQIKYIKNTTEDLRNHVIELPFGSVDAYQLYLMIADHTDKYMQQINEIIGNENFPE